jgi:hypothetical protein
MKGHARWGGPSHFSLRKAVGVQWAHKIALFGTTEMDCDASLFFPARAVLCGICDLMNPNADVIQFDHSLFASFAGPSWQVKDTGDFNGDNKSDILWQNSDGTPAIWLMDSMNFIFGSVAGSFNPGHDWHVIA